MMKLDSGEACLLANPRLRSRKVLYDKIAPVTPFIKYNTYLACLGLQFFLDTPSISFLIPLV